MKIDLDEAVLATRPFTSAPELGYEPIERILDGTKRHTLRKQKWSPGLYEVTIDGKRSGVIIRVLDTEREVLTLKEYLTDDFARADGFTVANGLTPGWNLMEFLCHLYDEPPEEMVLNRFEVVAMRDANGEWEAIDED